MDSTKNPIKCSCKYPEKTMKSPPETKLVVETSIESPDYDGILLVSAPDQKLKSSKLNSLLQDALSFDQSLKTEIGVLQTDLPARRVIYSPTGPIDTDYDDVRIFKNSAAAGIKRALKTGVKKLLVVLEEYPAFENTELVTLLGVLEALYTPIQVREHDPSKTNKVDLVGVYTENPDKTKAIVGQAQVLEISRRVACDIGDSDPERMTPAKVEEYVRNLFQGTNIKLSVVSDEEEFSKGYPLFAAVNRAASVNARHKGRIIYLEYNPPQAVKETLYIIGKGVTMDTGGVDVKIGGAMNGMSRDKCGAAATAGFMTVVHLLQPKHLKVVAALSMVRNSIGSNGYTTDEVITARSGARVRVINTDAEGRMIMADVLCKLKEDAVSAVNPHLYTIATLTGHAHRTVGEGYSIAMDNGPAKKIQNAEKLQAAGDKIGDIFEISRIRRDDFKHHKGEIEGDDLIQSAAKPSTMVSRGHQGPGAFLMVASGLDKHGSTSDVPLKYTHLDIAASAGTFPLPATGAPVLALAQAYLL
ncbi:putative aminopeptidase W07G4.4 isoform X1 [Diabrotica undecimpunctata]|uniref:putative aminopeptidase W07G4.4 isoform X1 n=2 Tax=Diabrotica undecimpunctata TaxID=50387 RepID=UPI003B6357FB